jgi:hypothetical protein
MCRTTNPGGGGSNPPVRATSPLSGRAQGVGEPGRPCLPWKQETGGSNPPALTILMPVSSVGRAPLSESGCPRFKSATGCQPTRCPSGQGALCKSAHAGSIPALVSKLQWLEWRGTDLLNRQMLVRIQPGAPLIPLAGSLQTASGSISPGRVAQRMSADFLHRRMHVRLVSRPPIWRVNWAGAQRRLLSDQAARR